MVSYSIALDHIKMGKKFRRHDWNRPKYVTVYELNSTKFLIMVMKDNSWGPYTPSNCDQFTDDWYEYVEPRT